MRRSRVSTTWAHACSEPLARLTSGPDLARRTRPGHDTPAIGVNLDLDRHAVRQEPLHRKVVAQVDREPWDRQRHRPAVGEDQHGLAAVSVGDLAEGCLLYTS